MNSIRNLGSVFALLIALICNTNLVGAPTPPPIPLPEKMIPFLRSEEDMIGFFQLEQRRLWYSLSSPTMVGENNQSYTNVQWTTAPSAREINNIIAGAKLKIYVVNTNDHVNFYASTSDARGYQLFQADSTEFPHGSTNGTWSLPNTYLSLKLSQYPALPNYLGVEGVTINTTDENGRTQNSRSFWADDNGVIRINRNAIVGPRQQGFVSFRINDGTSRTYDIQTGRQINRTQINSTTQSGFERVLPFRNQHVMYTVPSSSGIGENIIANLEVSTNNTPLTISVKTQENKLPLAYNFFIVLAGSTQTIAETLPAGSNGTVSRAFAAGLYSIVPVWDRASLSPPPNNNGCPDGYNCDENGGVGLGAETPETK